MADPVLLGGLLLTSDIPTDHDVFVYSLSCSSCAMVNCDVEVIDYLRCTWAGNCRLIITVRAQVCLLLGLLPSLVRC